MVGTLALVAAKFGAVVSYSLGTLPWLPGKEPLFGIRIDMLSCLMLLVITVVGFLVTLYSGKYMSRHNREHPSDAGQDRYYFFLVLFIAAMVGLVVSPNFFQLFIFWELTTFCSWGLIAFYGDANALRSAYKALLITHAGGLFLAAAIVIIFVNTGSFAFRRCQPAFPGRSKGRGALPGYRRAGQGCAVSVLYLAARRPWRRPLPPAPTCTPRPWSKRAFISWRGC